MSNALLLLADSQLLFRAASAPALHSRIRNRFDAPVEAAYIGAANGNDPSFYDFACQAIDTLLGRKCNTRFICHEKELPLEPSPLVVLAGGSVSQGWDFIGTPAVVEWLQRCRSLPGGLIIGVSAGAIHMARGIDPEQPASGARHYLNWLPMDVAVHEEYQGWPSLLNKPALGIPMGGGVWVEPAMESVGTQCFLLREDGQREHLTTMD